MAEVGMAGLDIVSPGIMAGLDIEGLIPGVPGLGGFAFCEEQPAVTNPAATAATPTPAATTLRYETFFICLSLLDLRKPTARGLDIDKLSFEFATVLAADG